MLNVEENAQNLVAALGTREGFLELVAIKMGKGPIQSTQYIDLATDDAIEQVIDFCERFDDTCDLYFGRNPRFRVPMPSANGMPTRSKSSDVRWVVSLGVDIDSKDHGNRLESVWECLGKAPFLPHYTLMTGHGVQAGWLLSIPMDLHIQENAKQVRQIQERLQTLTGADHTQNWDRIFRVMGSTNRKVPDAPVQTQVQWFLEREKHSWNEWDEALPASEPRETKVSFEIVFPATAPEVPWSKIPKWFIDKETKENRSDQDFYVCCSLLRFGLSIDEIYAVYQQNIPLSAKYQEKSQKGHGEDYLRRTLSAALGRLGNAVPCLIQQDISAVGAKSLDLKSTSEWVKRCLGCDRKQWSLMLWQVYQGSALEEKEFGSLVEVELINFLTGKTVNEGAPTLELPYTARMPDGFVVHEGRIFKFSPSVQMLSSSIQISIGSPILGYVAAIANRQIDESGLNLFEIVHDRTGRREAIIVPSSTVHRATDISKLADFGLDISSNEAKIAVDYFTSFSRTNNDLIPHLSQINRMGWKDKGFVFGSDLHHIENAVLARLDDGDRMLHEALDTREGTLERQLAMVKRALEHPKVALGIYASFAAPLLKLWNASSFAVEFAGTSSQGKSTTLQLIASLWAKADKRGGERNIIHQWKSTFVGHERYLAFLHHLPCFLDDTKTMIVDDKNRQIVVDVVYSLANGMGKSRGKIRGAQVTPTWRTVLLSTGEQPLESLSPDAGLGARVIDMWGSPFVNASKDLVDWFEFESVENCGWMGHEFIEFVVEHADEIQALGEQLPNWEQQYFQTSSNIGHRHAKFYAVIALAAQVVHGVFPQLGTFDIDPLDALFRSNEGSNSVKTQGIIALMHLESLVASEPEAFARASTSNVIKGRVQNLSADKIKYVAILPGIFEDLMRKYKLDSHGVLQEWREKGWLDTLPTKNGSTTNRIKCGDSKMYRLQLMNLPEEFQDGFRDPKFWVEVTNDIEGAKEVEKERQEKVVSFPGKSARD